MVVVTGIESDGQHNCLLWIDKLLSVLALGFGFRVKVCVVTNLAAAGIRLRHISDQPLWRDKWPFSLLLVRVKSRSGSCRNEPAPSKAR